jgi:hypothetical protein
MDEALSREGKDEGGFSDQVARFFAVSLLTSSPETIGGLQRRSGLVLAPYGTFSREGGMLRSLSCLFVSVAMVFCIPAISVSQATKTRLAGLVVVLETHVTIEGKDGIEITFDKASAERLLLLTNCAVGHECPPSALMRQI